eukprot:1736686-Pleurochrysis_carterae.AAC.2
MSPHSTPPRSKLSSGASGICGGWWEEIERAGWEVHREGGGVEKRNTERKREKSGSGGFPFGEAFSFR